MGRAEATPQTSEVSLAVSPDPPSLAGGFDAVENTALLAILAGRDGPLPAVARACATAKFSLLTAGWSYLLLALANNAAGSPPGAGFTRRGWVWAGL